MERKVKVIVRKDELIYYSEKKKDFVIVKNTEENFPEILNYIISCAETFDEDYLEKLIEFPNEKIKEYSKNKISFEKDKIKIEDVEIPQAIFNKIKELKNGGYSFERFYKFWERCKTNPNINSVMRLFDFLEHENLVIDEDGCFYVYKGIGKDYFDKHSHTFDNHPGNTCEMERDKVVYDPNSFCSSGLHVGTLNYAKDYAGEDIVVMVKVDPHDVVSVPYDSQCQKMRVCKYYVVSEYIDDVSKETSVVDQKIKSIEKDFDNKDLDKNKFFRSKIHWEKWEDKNLKKLKKCNLDWNQIGEKMNRSAESCRKRWKKL